MFQPTIRLRLTLLYGGLFLVGGLLVLGGTYQLIARALPVTGLERRIESLRQNNPNGPQFRLIETQLRERRQALRAVREKSRLVLIAVTLGALALGWFVAGRVLRPIQQITLHAQRASAENLSDRIDLRGPPDELHELANTFDAMLDRLQSAFIAQQLFAGQVSHELRTPLAIMRAAADVSLANREASPTERELAATILSSVARSEHLIDGLLVLSRSESAILDSVPLDLADLAGSSLAQAARRAGEAGASVDDGDLANAPMRGDPVLLQRLCDNLIDNAIKYNVPGGWLRVTTGITDSHAQITVANSGPAIDPARVDEFFRPFQRGAPDLLALDHAPGFGLGLAIVRAVVRAHGGAIVAQPLPEGGLSISATFPQA